MAEIDDAALNSLAAKLDSLDLTDDEKTLLDTIMQQAAAYEPDVEGFAFSTTSYQYTGIQSGAQLSPTAFKLGSALQLIGSPSLMMEFGGGGPPPP